MIVTLGWWAIPLAVSVLAWAWGFFWPYPPRQSDYDFGNVILAMGRGAACIIATLMVWLVWALLR